MPLRHHWTGREVRQLKRFSEILFLAGYLKGRDDYLASLMLEDALEELHGLLGEGTQPISMAGG